ncbi:hypothetical protein [Vibrio parahaemolyticus]|uniref:hypothetical protein n=1 Tax=Vibrio parahaemolyticus TaxID=670 RepID=UPI00215D33C2|nr:hypothetical protein [Vibrio parahaemolyticus]EHR5320637.1 hypothetical protein [Vibrio parahaemolyticus]MCR9728101.1 hypothetical protein [Vibrio parahaemolyticus]MCR9754228.1 hypothetical protein [Vibrio parahaemolyticus]MCR9786760.1 hypothetical protein [Vibrio parahaemolyticus]MCR9856718.1 hypothetical protein [Vibrio parahaemolyticus]
MGNSASTNFAVIQTLSTGRIYHSQFVKLGIGVTGAVMLSQACYLSSTETAVRRGGWFYKTAEDWKEETGLSRREQETARKKLKNLGIFIEQKRGIPCKIWTLLDSAKLIELLGQISMAESAKLRGDDLSSMADSAKQDGTNAPNSVSQIRTTKTKTTTKTTTNDSIQGNGKQVSDTVYFDNRFLSTWKNIQNHVEDEYGINLHTLSQKDIDSIEWAMSEPYALDVWDESLFESFCCVVENELGKAEKVLNPLQRAMEATNKANMPEFRWCELLDAYEDEISELLTGTKMEANQHG